MKIAYVNGICQKHDAISDAICNEISWLVGARHQVKLYTYRCDYHALNYCVVSGVLDIILDDFFKSAQIIVFHFGVYSPLVDAIFAVPNNSKKIVVFHNITPAEFLPPKSATLIAKSFSQLQNLRYADRVICVSDVNLSILREHGVPTSADIVPLAAWKGRKAPAIKPSFSDGVVRLAFIGRLVKSKGAMDLLALVRHLLCETKCELLVDVVFNPEMSDTSIIDAVAREARAINYDFSSRVSVVLHENANNARKEKILDDADLFCLPTRHEGFCVPIIEAMSAGCRVLSYENSNVPFISGGLASLALDGDVSDFLARGLAELRTIVSDVWKEDGYHAYGAKVLHHVEMFSEHSVRPKFMSAIGV